MQNCVRLAYDMVSLEGSLNNKMKKIIDSVLSNKIFIIYSLIIFLYIINIMYMGSFNPDYQPYKEVFFDIPIGNKFYLNRDPFYILLNSVFKKIGFDYYQFRLSILSIYTLILILILKKINKFYFKNNYSKIYLFIGLLALSIFYFEFLVIRVRAGLAILLTTYAVLLLITDKKFIVSGFLLVLAWFSHSYTTPIILLFFGIGLLFSFKWMDKLKFGPISIIFGLSFVCGLEYLTNIRGGPTFSNMNPLRFVFTGIIPFLLFLYTYYKNKIDKNGDSKLILFVNNIFIIYISIIAGLIIAYPLGFVEVSAESLLRVLYLFNLIFSLELLFLQGQYSIIIGLISSINAMFFVRSIFLQDFSVFLIEKFSK